MADHVEASLGKKSVQGAAWAGISRAVYQAAQAVSVAVLARFLSPGDYGLMSMSGFFVNLLQQLGDMGTGSALVQREHISPRLTSSLFWMNVLLGLAGAVLLWIATPAVALYYKEPRVALPLSVLALSFPLTGIGIVPLSLLAREMEYRKLCIVEISASLGAALVSILAAWRGAGVWSLVAGSLFLAAASTALGWIYSGWRPQWVLALSEIRSVLGFSMNLTGFVMVNYFSRNAGHLIAGRHLGAEALGYYQMAYALLLYPLQAMAWVLGRVMFAAFARMQTDLERFRSGFQRYLTLLGAIFFPVFLGLTVVADPLIRLFLGPKWLPVIPLFMIVAPFGALHAITSPSGQIYLSSGRTDVMLKVGVASMVVQVFGYLAGVPWGLRGILLGWAIASVPAGIAGLVVSHRIIGARVGPLLRNLRGPAGAALAMMAAAWCWRWFLDVLGITSAAVDLVSTTITGAAVYLVLVLLPRPEFLRDVGRILTYSDQAILLRLRAWMARYVPD